jgi:formylglycine-generating enzyme required for sulfatase activity
MPKSFDVFLSHNSKDNSVVRELAAQLRARGLRVWLDVDNLLPGHRWQEELEDVIRTSGAGAVLVGSDGLGPWEEPEMRALLSQFVQRRLKVIPVLLPGAPGQPELPPFLAEFVWSDLRGGLTQDAVDRLAEGIRQRPAPKGRPDPLDHYRTWAAERYGGLSLIGLGGGDLGRLSFDEIYVPLRIVRRREAMAGPRTTKKLRRDRPNSDELDIESLFTTPAASNPHTLLLGDPGAGKTTGLLKLLHRCLASGGPTSLGLAPETLPVFLRLRRFTAEDLDRPLADFLQRELVRELGEVAKGEVPLDLGARLWKHGRLLLLLDGLDELADAGLRARVCQFLDDWELSRRPQFRAVLSCRFSGYGAKVRLGKPFAPLEVRPLDAEQCRSLVRHWFRAAQRALPDRLSTQGALKATDGLIAALDGPGYGSQRWKVLVGSPLLLTLLCVIAYRGGQMPRHRTAFYDQCLRVLLGPWSRGRRDEPALPPLDEEAALAALRAIAWRLHRRGSWDDLSLAELAVVLDDCLAPRGQQVPSPQVLAWLHREAGVLTDYGEHRYGLLHLGLQEYLAASYVASQGTALLDELCAHAGEEWWEEVFLLLAGLPGHAVFAPLMGRLLRSPALLDRADLIRACLEEAAEPDFGPFLDVLGSGESADRQATVLRLLRGRNDPRIGEAARALLNSPDPDVRALAAQIVGEVAAQPAATAGESGAVFVLHHAADREAAGALAHALRGRGWRATAAAENSSWREDPELLVRDAHGVVCPVGAAARPPWSDPELESCLTLFARHRRPIVLAELPNGGGRPELPPFLSAPSWVDLRGGLDAAVLAALDHALAGAPAPVAERPDPRSWSELLVEPLTRMRFVWIPGGRFAMGGTASRDEWPVRPVRVSPFWLGETPVTNAQYAVFLEMTGAREPSFWRDRRFSSASQPVVGVRWKDAQESCRWLEEAWGRPVLLPSEAQWEFAARGPEGRTYPWGNEEPDTTRACFGLDPSKGQPAPVGSYPAGRGPFGTLDQAGNVWEWCRDARDLEIFARKVAKGEESLDPCVEGDEAWLRAVRGGGWDNLAGKLRAAFRGRNPASFQEDSVGFRLTVGLGNHLKTVVTREEG